MKRNSFPQELLDQLKASCETYDFKPQSDRELHHSFRASVREEVVERFPQISEFIKVEGTYIRINEHFLNHHNEILKFIPYVFDIGDGEYDLYSGDIHVGKISYLEIAEAGRVGYTVNIKFNEPIQKTVIEVDIGGNK